MALFTQHELGQISLSNGMFDITEITLLYIKKQVNRFQCVN